MRHRALQTRIVIYFYFLFFIVKISAITNTQLQGKSQTSLLQLNRALCWSRPNGFNCRIFLNELIFSLLFFIVHSFSLFLLQNFNLSGCYIHIATPPSFSMVLGLDMGQLPQCTKFDHFLFKNAFLRD